MKSGGRFLSPPSNFARRWRRFAAGCCGAELVGPVGGWRWRPAPWAGARSRQVKWADQMAAFRPACFVLGPSSRRKGPRPERRQQITKRPEVAARVSSRRRRRPDGEWLGQAAFKWSLAPGVISLYLRLT